MSETEVLEFVQRLLPEAGRLLANFQPQVSVRNSRSGAQDLELMERADAFVDEILIKELRKHFPLDEIISECSGLHEGAGEFLWYLDPVDGSRNFIHGSPMYCSSVGLCFRNAPVAGLVHLPAFKKTYEAVAGQGAFANGNPLMTTPVDEITRTLISTGLPYRRREILSELIGDISAFIAAGSGLRRTGSAVMDLCWVAEGYFDACWEINLKPWDFCAASVIVQEAGGRITDFRGEPLSLDMADVVATNGRLHEAVVELLARAGDESLN
jgi:myo-inositol-1(or 4)-monophosphatase